MRAVLRILGIGYLAVVALMVLIKAFVPLPAAIGYAPFPWTPGPAGRPIDLVVWHSPAQRAWLTEAAQRFEAGRANVGGRPIRVQLYAIEAPELVTRIGQEDWSNAPQPHVLIPGSSLWVEVIRSEWAATRGGSIVRGGADAPRPLAFSPLVAVAWEDQANLLWPDGAATFWNDLQAALAEPAGWAGVAAAQGFAEGSVEVQRAASWGAVKVAQPAPLTTDSGMQALILMSYAFHGKTANMTSADAADPALQRWLQPIAAGMLNTTADSVALMDDLVRSGPERYDVILVEEQVALMQILNAQSRWGRQIRLYYPPAAAVSDHPFVVLDAPFSGDAERAAAGQLRSFLLRRETQELARQNGLRPAEPAVALTAADASNPFVLYAPLGVRSEYGRQVEPPSSNVLTALQTLWRETIDQYTLLPQEEP